ncbi:hypothetical protein T484DRAFT_1927483 [Baffinella frigidus]|nr:hypothetical protein T484DRAFT_1927483 [Cryptophyta sp. CCMP2293]
MDADWGSSSDDEETAAKKVVARAVETEKLLNQFQTTCKREDARTESKYGSMDPRERFEAERTAAVGKAMWKERLERAGKEKLEDADIQRTYKGYIACGVVLALVLVYALFGLYRQFTGILSGGGSAPGDAQAWNATGKVWMAGTTKGPHNNTRLGDVHLPPVWLFCVAAAMGIGIPTCILCIRQRKAGGRGVASFAAEL